MGWVLRHNWLWALLAFLLGAVITWFLLARREQSQPKVVAKHQEPAEEKTEVLVGAGVGTGTTHAAPPSRSEPADRGRDEPAEPFDQDLHEPAAERPAPPVARQEPPPAAEGENQPAPAVVARPVFSRRMDAERAVEPTLFDEPEPVADVVQDSAVPVGRYGEGSADAVPHQGPPDGFTIKGNAQSMLFHTPDSPYYGRTKPEVWFRTETDAERAGFTKYVRKPRKSARPTD